jgi:hypothetical protein
MMYPEIDREDSVLAPMGRVALRKVCRSTGGVGGGNVNDGGAEKTRAMADTVDVAGRFMKRGSQSEQNTAESEYVDTANIYQDKR